MATYSHTRLGTFEQCPRKYWYAYVAKVKVEAAETIEAFLGQRVHESLEELYRRALNGQIMNSADLVDDFNAAWKEHWHSEVLIVDRRYKKADFQRVGHKALQAYHARYWPFDQSQTLALECLIKLDLDGTGRYRMVGYVDRLAQRADGTYEIHDYKTNKGLPTQSDVDQNRQLALYHMGVKGQWKDALAVDLVWHFVRFDKEIRSSRTSEQLDQVRRQCVGLIDQIESLGQDESAFSTCKTRLCNWCPYQELCPATRHAATVSKLPAKQFKADDGVRLVDQLVQLDMKRDTLKGQLNAIDAEEEKLYEQIAALAQQMGLQSIAGRTHHVDVVTRTQAKFPGAGDDTRTAFEAAIRKAGLWDQVTTLNAQKLKSLWNKGLPPAAVKILRRYASEEVRPELRLRKGGVKNS